MLNIINMANTTQLNLRIPLSIKTKAQKKAEKMWTNIKKSKRTQKNRKGKDPRVSHHNGSSFPVL